MIVIQEREKKLAKVIVAVIALAVVAPQYARQWSADYLQTESRERESLEAKVADLTEKLAGIEDQRQLLRLFISDYRKWEDSGSLDDHNLINWVRTMESIKNQRKLFEISFNFGDERELRSSESKFTEGSTAAISLVEMRVELDMLHDMDFLMFMESLDENTSALFFPSECAIDRVTSEFALQQRVNMKSTCTIRWLAVRDPDRRVAEEGEETEEAEETAQTGGAAADAQGS